MKIARAASAVLTCAVLGAVGTTSVDAAASGKSAAVTTLTAEQRAALRAELARYLRQDNDGLVSKVRADGSVELELDGRHGHLVVARPSQNSRPELACFDDPDAALGYLARDERRTGSSTTTGPKVPPEERDR